MPGGAIAERMLEACGGAGKNPRPMKPESEHTLLQEANANGLSHFLRQRTEEGAGANRPSDAAKTAWQKGRAGGVQRKEACAFASALPLTAHDMDLRPRCTRIPIP